MPKSSKPRPDFPLFPHASGRWAKKVRGRFRYFGKVADDPKGEAALNLWLEQRDDLLAGREPRAKAGAFTVKDAANHFLTFKLNLQTTGELAPRTFQRYKANCETIVSTLGKSTPVEFLTPADFEGLRVTLAKRRGPVALGNEIQMVRCVFRYVYEAGLIDRPIRFGPGFKKPSAKTLRIQRAKGGLRMFEREELVALLNAATVNLKAMALLGINGGLGNTDIALLTLGHLDLKGGWLDYPRVKTGVDRRVPLFPETVDAIKAALAARREPTNPEDSDLVFIGRRGESYRGGHKGYRVTQEMARALTKAKIARKGLMFYSLRRTFQTIAEGAHDLAAVQSIMGHAPAANDMSAVYRQRVDDHRLQAVVDHVRRWLFD